VTEKSAAGRSATVQQQGGDMAQSSGKQDASERIPFMQRLLDNPFLLLFLGVAVPAILYMIWGIMEIIQIPVAR
jgi:hypothetical protein